LIQNIVVCGGGAMIPGFKRALLEQISHITKDSRYTIFQNLVKRLQFVSHPFRIDSLLWIGGSLVGSAKIPIPKITRNEFTISDWTFPGFNPNILEG
jgi:actin-related protein